MSTKETPSGEIETTLVGLYPELSVGSNEQEREVYVTVTLRAPDSESYKLISEQLDVSIVATSWQVLLMYLKDAGLSNSAVKQLMRETPNLPSTAGFVPEQQH